MAPGLQRDEARRMTKATGAAFVLADHMSDVVLRRTIDQAKFSVPQGRLLFVIWSQSDTWTKSLSIESIVVQHVLGPVSSREKSDWEFYGCGTSRLYKRGPVRLSRTVMWVGLRNRGPKAYARLRDTTLHRDTENASRIPVSDKVFTRDVANNVWHLKDPQGLSKVVARLQALTTWNDEVAEVFSASGRTRRSHKTLSLENDLVPVASRTEYEFQDFPFSTTTKASSQNASQLQLF